MNADSFNECPVPISADTITMAHGGGGRLMQRLLEKLVWPIFYNPALNTRHDSALLEVDGKRLAFTTDSFVVRPLFFPGGDIGMLAVNGTVNDLAMAGARPRFISVGLIIEEGFSFADLERVLRSMRKASDAAGVQIVTGDIKVVDKGKGDQLFINTSGIGTVESKSLIAPQSVKAGDAILVSGDLGRHGIAVMAEREGLQFETTVESDCASIFPAVAALMEAGVEIHCLRDLTRGGLSSALNEIVEVAGMQALVRESEIAVESEVRGACEILGLDPLYIANEGRFLAIVKNDDAEKALSALRAQPVSQNARIIGCIEQATPPMVVLRTSMGSNRVLDMLSGEQLPRIC